MRSYFLIFILILLLEIREVWSWKAPYLRDRPRGLGLLQLPTGISDERSGPFLPGLYIAGNKVNQKPQTVPDVHLPGQPADFTGRSAFNPFTHMVSAVYAEDLSDGWGAGMAVNGVNGHGLNVRKNFDSYADVPLNLNDGMYQPFIAAATVGGEYDLSKMREVSGSLDLPIPGVNELFDLNARILVKTFLLHNSAIEFPLTLSDPNERAPYNFRYAVWAPDRHMAYGHVVPNVNPYVIGKDKIMERLMQNRLNPTMVG
ncbi:Aromatic peroxygenase [Caenorhabditis elegans]|uniref:Aromatic peroxygenase n=1 Tax=Caenorhabditis elegans TaxID=6239 RepID=O16540_CAEEL|nr:Aromatic peroxygenase [Caenorhabditis elegans]CCD64908.1 Aromatic peroxygenase [Caenorhabditis elegans]|eukprot:NP_494486.1 Uncharacterized protein CELE_C17F4.3 [Caenorhabditis elegans]